MIYFFGVILFSFLITLCYWYYIIDVKIEVSGLCDLLGYRLNEWWGGEVSRFFFG